MPKSKTLAAQLGARDRFLTRLVRVLQRELGAATKAGIEAPPKRRRKQAQKKRRLPQPEKKKAPAKTKGGIKTHLSKAREER